MGDPRERLTNCFVAVFPNLRGDEINDATSTTVQGWDSVAGVTLLAVVEEEFGISIDDNDLTRFNSFHGFLSYLQEAMTDNSSAV